MSDSNFGKVFAALLGGAAIGATLGILFAPAKGTVTRRQIARKSRDIKNNVTDKLQDLVESAEEIIEDIRETANEYMYGSEEEEVIVEDQKSAKKTK